jgi:hypothetical protein
MFPRGYYQRSRVEDAAARLRRALDIAVEAESLPLVVDLVRRGHGVATLLAAAAVDLPGNRDPGAAGGSDRAGRGLPPRRCAANAAVEAFHAYLLRHARGRLGGALAQATGAQATRIQPAGARARRAIAALGFGAVAAQRHLAPAPAVVARLVEEQEAAVAAGALLDAVQRIMRQHVDRRAHQPAQDRIGVAGSGCQPSAKPASVETTATCG